VNPKLRSLLSRVTLVGGVAVVASLVAKGAPHDQTIAIRLGDRPVTHLEAAVTRVGERESSAGFSQDFIGKSPRFVRHTFSAPNGTYILSITFRELTHPEPPVAAGTATGDAGPIPAETSFERRVSLAGGEVIVSPE
jgi:hypothetical protein